MTGRQKITIVLLSGLYLLMAGVIAWLSGRAFIFPSLGPTAYVLAFDIMPDTKHSGRVVIGGHICGVFGGLFSYHLLVSPNTLMGLAEPISFIGAFLGLGAVAALMATTLLMLMFNVSHPPACATTLIISLGILSDPIDAAVIIGAVILMYICYWVVQNMLTGELAAMK